MCASGIPVEDSFNPILITLAGLEIVNFMISPVKIWRRQKEIRKIFEICIEGTQTYLCCP